MENNNEGFKIGNEVAIDALKNELERLKDGSHLKWSTESKEDVEKYMQKIESDLQELESKK